MNIINFLEIIQKTPDLSGVFLISIIEKEKTFSPNFSSNLYNYLKSYLSSNIIFINIDQNSLNTLRSQFEMSFLGSKCVYFLKDFNVLDKSEKKSWYNYLSNYKGPHCIIFTDDQEPFYPESASNYIVNLFENITEELYVNLYKLFYAQSCDLNFVKKIFKNQSKINLEEACNLMRYQISLGRKLDNFFPDWFERILIPEKSLFNLSQAFFAKDKKTFFELWEKFKNIYPEEFWIIYWSEQLWQAIVFLQKIQTSSLLEAKKAIKNLPFSFINKDYKRYNINSLISMHNNLYQLDYNLKNGISNDYSLEYWYLKFFQT